MSVVGSIGLIIPILAVISVIIIAIVVLIIFLATRKSSSKREYVPQETVTPRQEEMRKNLGETLRELRTERNMTQEFVAESLGISRQAVSKWENGTSEPSTTNLIAIANLYGIEPEELLKKLAR